MGIATPEVSSFVKEVEKKSRFRLFTKKTFLSRSTGYLIPSINPKKKSHLVKLRYINTRLGRVITKEEINRFKLVFDLNEFLNLNDIDYHTLYKRENYDEFVKNHVGFLSFDQSFIIFRNIDTSSPIRYRNYRILDKKREDESKIFITKDKIDILSERFELVITEGVFDLMQIMKYFHSSDVIGLSANGSGQGTTLRKAFSLGLFPCTAHIYLDNDSEQKKRKINRIIQQSGHFARSNYTDLHIYSNKFPNEKDFGVPFNKIQRDREVIKL